MKLNKCKLKIEIDTWSNVLVCCTNSFLVGFFIMQKSHDLLESKHPNSKLGNMRYD